MRVALVEEAAGSKVDYANWMGKSQAILRGAGWKDSSEAHLRDVVQQLNKRDGVESPMKTKNCGASQLESVCSSALAQATM